MISPYGSCKFYSRPIKLSPKFFGSPMLFLLNETEENRINYHKSGSIQFNALFSRSEQHYVRVPAKIWNSHAKKLRHHHA